MTDFTHVAAFRADQALRVLEAALDANDASIAAVARRVRAARLSGRRVARSDLDLIEAFDAAEG